MRISTSQLSLSGIDVILEKQARLQEIQQQVATGKRIINPSDDPAGAARIVDLKQTVEQAEQFQSNIVIARQRQQYEEASLTSIGDVLQRVRELALQGNNDSQNNTTRRNIASEIRERLSELVELANTKDANGEYLYAGFQGKTRPFEQLANGTFAFNGDDGQRMIQIDQSRQIADSDSGNYVFRAIKNGNGTFTTLDTAANKGTGTIDPGDITDPAAYVRDTYTVRMADTTSVAGGAIGITDANANDTLAYELRVNGTLVYTGAEGSSRTQAQLAADIAAQSGTTGVTAYVSGGVLYLANTTPTGNAITVSETLTGATEDTDTVTGYFGSSLTGLTTPTATVTFDAPSSGYVIIDSGSNIDAAGTFTDGGQITFNGMRTSISGAPQNGDTFTISPSVNQDVFTTVQNLANALESSGNLTQLHNAINRVLVDIDRAQDRILEVRGSIGGRLNALDSQESNNEDFLLTIQTALAGVEDVDLSEAISLLNFQEVGLQAAQQSYLRIQNLSLFDLL
jgi:flagellar hook-associated protein 3 FlgL